MLRRPGWPGRLSASFAARPSLKRPPVRAALVLLVLAAGAASAFACSPSADETPTQTPPRDNGAEAQPVPDVIETPSPTPPLPAATMAPAPSETVTPVPPPAPEEPPRDLGKFTLIPEADRRPPPDFQLATAAGEPFSVVDRSGEVIVLYQTEF